MPAMNSSLSHATITATTSPPRLALAIAHLNSAKRSARWHRTVSAIFTPTTPSLFASTVSDTTAPAGITFTARLSPHVARIRYAADVPFPIQRKPVIMLASKVAVFAGSRAHGLRPYSHLAAWLAPVLQCSGSGDLACGCPLMYGSGTPYNR